MDSATKIFYDNLSSITLIVVGLMVIFYYLIKEVGYISELDKKAVLITGCDRGFGHVLAKRLDKLGITVFAGCLFSEGEGAEQLRLACSQNLHVLQLDVTKDEDVKDAVSIVKKSLGDKKLWAIVNNAGIFEPNLVEWTCMEKLKQMFDVNTLGPLRITKAFLPLLRSSRGRIVIVSSLADTIIIPLFGGYAMTKHAVTALGKALRTEVARFGISVHLIRPTAYDTALGDDKVMHRSLENGWNGLSKEACDTYGDKYLDHLKDVVKFTKKCLLLPESSMYEVVDSLTDATVGVNPKFSNVPGLVGKLFSIILQLTPVSILETVKGIIIERPTILDGLPIMLNEKSKVSAM